jgi:hypothetical protein
VAKNAVVVCETHTGNTTEYTASATQLCRCRAMSGAMQRDPDVTRDAQRPRSPGGDEIMNAGPRYGKAGHTDPRKSEENPDAKRRDQGDDLADYMDGLNGKGEGPLTSRVESHAQPSGGAQQPPLSPPRMSAFAQAARNALESAPCTTEPQPDAAPPRALFALGGGGLVPGDALMRSGAASSVSAGATVAAPRFARAPTASLTSVGSKTRGFAVLLRTDSPSVLDQSSDGFGAFNISEGFSSCSIAWTARGYQVTCTSETPLGILRSQDGSREELEPGETKTLYDKDTVFLDPGNAPLSAWLGLARDAVPNSDSASRFAHAIDAAFSLYKIYSTHWLISTQAGRDSGESPVRLLPRRHACGVPRRPRCRRRRFSSFVRGGRHWRRCAGRGGRRLRVEQRVGRLRVGRRPEACGDPERSQEGDEAVRPGTGDVE